MFIGMGVSAVFPVLDGLRMFGLSQLQKQIGLSWLVLQGFLYILGAMLYAVSLLHVFLSQITECVRHECQKPCILGNLTPLEAPTRYFMSSSSWPQFRTSGDY